MSLLEYLLLYYRWKYSRLNHFHHHLYHLHGRGVISQCPELTVALKSAGLGITSLHLSDKNFEKTMERLEEIRQAQED